MKTRSWKVYGVVGHRQAVSFRDSYEFQSYGRKVEVECSDKTGTNEFVIVRITAEDSNGCRRELDAQVQNGIFENARVGEIIEVA